MSALLMLCRPERKATGAALTDKLSKGWVGLGDVRLDEVLGRGALLLSRAEIVSTAQSRNAISQP